MKFSDLNLYAVGDTIQMSGAMYSGDGKTFLVFFPEDKNEFPIETLELDADEWKQFLRQTDLLETEMLAKAKDGTLTKAIVRKSQRQIDAVLSWRVFKRDAYRCRYCANDNTPLTVDHLVRWEEGGPTTEDNLVACCKKCNKTRGNTSYADWLQHPHYVKVSANLDGGTRAANEALVGALDKVKRVINVRSR